MAGRLGAWPTDPYFDPNRPWWVPYFIDTPTESEAKYADLLYSVTPQQIIDPAASYKPPVVMPTPAAPQTEAEMRNWTPEQAAAAYLEKFKAWQKIAIPALPEDDNSSNLLLWVALGAAGLLTVAWMIGGSRR